MAYKFNMQQILQYRQGLEDREKEELARRNRLLEEAARKLENLQEEEERTFNTWREQSSGEIDIFHLHTTSQYMQSLTGKIKNQAREKTECNRRVSEQRENVRKRWQECRIMEILKEKSFQEYQAEEKKTDRRINDDLSLKGFLRRNNPESKELLLRSEK